MNEKRTGIRRPRFSLRTLFILMAVSAALMAWFMHDSRLMQERREYIRAAGALNGHPRTMQGIKQRWVRTRLRWWLFNDSLVDEIWLYPGTYSEDDLAYIRKLYPEARITDCDAEISP